MSNQAAFDKTPYHMVGSLVPSQHLDLLALPDSSFQPMKGEFVGHKVYRSHQSIMGKERTVLVVFNPNRFLGQQQGLMTKLKKAEHALRTICKRLEARRSGAIKSGKAPTLESIQKQVDTILSHTEVRSVIKVELTELDDLPQLSFYIDQTAIADLAKER